MEVRIGPLTACKSWGGSSDHQAWWQLPLPSESYFLKQVGVSLTLARACQFWPLNEPIGSSCFCPPSIGIANLCPTFLLFIFIFYKDLGLKLSPHVGTASALLTATFPLHFCNICKGRSGSLFWDVCDTHLVADSVLYAFISSSCLALESLLLSESGRNLGTFTSLSSDLPLQPFAGSRGAAVSPCGRRPPTALWRCNLGCRK